MVYSFYPLPQPLLPTTNSPSKTLAGSVNSPHAAFVRSCDLYHSHMTSGEMGHGPEIFLTCVCEKRRWVFLIKKPASLSRLRYTKFLSLGCAQLITAPSYSISKRPCGVYSPDKTIFTRSTLCAFFSGLSFTFNPSGSIRLAIKAIYSSFESVDASF